MAKWAQNESANDPEYKEYLNIQNAKISKKSKYPEYDRLYWI